MFPTFITSFQDQMTAVAINLFGTVLGGILTALSSAFVTTIVTPILKNLATALGLTPS